MKRIATRGNCSEDEMLVALMVLVREGVGQQDVV